MIDVSIANEAVQLLKQDRQDQYGDFEENLARIAELWSSYLEWPVTSENVAAMMVLVKISRSRNGYLRDNTVDGIAYLLMMDALGDTNGTR